MENNKFWGSKVNVLKANPTSTVNGQGFKWVNNLIVHSYDGKLGSLATDTKTSTGKTVWYNYNNDVLRHLLTTETFGYNDFVYTLSEGQADPIVAHNANLAEKSEHVEIRTAEDLMAMTAKGKYKLMANIDLDGIVWTSIGTEDEPFIGEFDGNGYDISNFTAASDSSVSLFGVCDGAVITDLNVLNASVSVIEGSDDVYAAVLAHKAIGKTEITDCVVSGTVDAESSADVYAAGICAYNEASDIEGSDSNVIVTATSDATAYAAGVCAYLYSDAKLSDCINYGDANGTAEVLYKGRIYAYDEAYASFVPVVDNCVDMCGIYPGDADGDGKVSARDVVVMTRAAANWNGYEDAVNVTNADFNEDGKVTLIDIVYLARHLAGWVGYEDLPVTMPQA